MKEIKTIKEKRIENLIKECGSKQCTRCGKNFPLTSKYFYRNRKAKDGFRTVCKSCRGIQDNQYYKLKKNNLKIKWENEKKERARSKRLLATYGISEEEYKILLESQNNKCAICNEEKNEILFVDHDHKTGEMRELLCRNCNSALGLIKESPYILRRMIRYIEKRL